MAGKMLKKNFEDEKVWDIHYHSVSREKKWRNHYKIILALDTG